MLVSQHDRIVEELLNALASTNEARNRYNNLWNCAGNRLALAQVEIRKVTSERYAALARVAELEKALAESEKRGSELVASHCDGVIGDEYGRPHCRYKVERDAALAEASHMLDSHAVRVHQKADGLLMVNARGKSRFMNWRERLARWLLKGSLEILP